MGILGGNLGPLGSHGAFAADPAASPGFALLAIDGRNVKWGAPRLGTPAVIRYAFIAAPVTRPGTRNCGAMLPFPPGFAGTESGGESAGQSRLAAEFRQAFAAWENIAGIRFQEAGTAANADLILGVQARPRGIAFADISLDPGPGSGLARIRKAAICFNPNRPWETAFDGDRKTYDVRLVAIHEIGHVLGLDHARGKAWRVMDFRYREHARVPQSTDAAGAAFLYGSGPVRPPRPPSEGSQIAGTR